MPLRAIWTNIKTPLIIFICALFTFGGAVNLGWTGFATAIPFMFFWYITIRQSKKLYIIISAMLSTVILGLYVLKKIDSDIFYPANGMTITLNKDVCFIKFPNFFLIKELKNAQDCELIPDASYMKIGRAGTKYTIIRTEISHADMSERAVVYASNGDEEVCIYDLTFFNNNDNTVLNGSDLSQPYFYYPSALMLWPALPLLPILYL